MTRWRCSGGSVPLSRECAEAHNLGVMGADGRGVLQDYKMAVQVAQARGRAGECHPIQSGKDVC
ncbi:MAG: hypothetical protein ACYYK0_01545 [Candidatus Eutrophobiaceae bacterium]